MEEETPYEQFVSHMKKIGLRKEFSILEEKDVALSEDEEIIYITIPTTGKYNTVSIKGIKEASIGGRIVTHPYYIFMRIYGYDGEEAKPEDTIQFSITEFKKGLPTASDIKSHIIYYNYPYSIASKRLRLKKGIIITKDRRLEIKIVRKGKPIKIGKIEMKMECDKWFKEILSDKDDIQNVGILAR